MEDAQKIVAVDQDFALVISGDVPLPGQGVLALDPACLYGPGRD